MIKQVQIIDLQKVFVISTMLSVFSIFNLAANKNPDSKKAVKRDY